MFYRGPQVYQFFHNCHGFTPFGKGVTLPYLTYLLYMRRRALGRDCLPISTQSSSAHVEERDQEPWGALD